MKPWTATLAAKLEEHEELNNVWRRLESLYEDLEVGGEREANLHWSTAISKAQEQVHDEIEASALAIGRWLKESA